MRGRFGRRRPAPPDPSHPSEPPREARPLTPHDYADFVEMRQVRPPPHYSMLKLSLVFLAGGALVVGGHVLRSLGTAPTVSLTHAASGDPALGAALYGQYGCGGCHAADPLSVRRGEVGPSLYDFPQRVMIAGRLGNNEQNLIRFIAHPQRVAPGSGMPDLGVSEEEARHIAAYLYTLGGTPR